MIEIIPDLHRKGDIDVRVILFIPMCCMLLQSSLVSRRRTPPFEFAVKADNLILVGGFSTYSDYKSVSIFKL